MQKKLLKIIQHPFRIMSPKQLFVEGMYINIVKAIYNKMIANIILNGEKLKLFPLMSVTRQWCPFSPLLFNIMIKFLARAIRQE
jgi:hypothetical protein